MSTPLVAIVMGSQSDWSTMRHAGECLDALGVEYDARIVSAHRTPERLYAFAKGAADEGFKVIVAGAGGAAHLPGMIAALTHLPVLGVPVRSKALSGQDSLLSIVQMPAGVPVGTLAIGEAGASNAGLLAAGILALSDDELAERLREWRARQTESVAERPAADPEPVPPPPPPPEAVQPPADPVLPTIEEAPASYVPGWDARAIREIAIERYGGYEPMFEAHGWTERGSEMMRKVQSRVKDHYGSVSTFVEHHRLHRGPLLNSPPRSGGGLDPIRT